MYSTTPLATIVLATVPPEEAQTTPVPLRSPNGELEIQFATLAGGAPSEQGQLAYRVTFRANPVLDWSKMARIYCPERTFLREILREVEVWSTGFSLR